MNEAPSEKHLEEWVVENITHVVPHAAVLARQLRLPSGVLDVLAYASQHNMLHVLELKKGLVDTRTVVQVLRYMNDLQGIYQEVVGTMFVMGVLDRREFDYTFEKKSHIGGYVIGRDIESAHVLYACEAANIAALTYTYDGQQYAFNVLATGTYKALAHEHERFRHPPLTLAMKEIVFQELSRARKAGQL